MRRAARVRCTRQTKDADTDTVDTEILLLRQIQSKILLKRYKYNQKIQLQIQSKIQLQSEMQKKIQDTNSIASIDTLESIVLMFLCLSDADGETHKCSSDGGNLGSTCPYAVWP